jgi:hypothetical protein
MNITGPTELNCFVVITLTHQVLSYVMFSIFVSFHLSPALMSLMRFFFQTTASASIVRIPNEHDQNKNEICFLTLLTVGQSDLIVYILEGNQVLISHICGCAYRLLGALSVIQSSC